MVVFAFFGQDRVVGSSRVERLHQELVRPPVAFVFAVLGFGIGELGSNFEKERTGLGSERSCELVVVKISV